MDESLSFKEESLNSLGRLNADVGALLIHLIHVLKSKNVAEDIKLAVRDEVVEFGRELNAFYSSIDLDSLSKYDIRETERRIVAKNEEAHRQVERLLQGINKRCDILIDRNMLFPIAEIVDQLGNIKISNEYAITKDKIENLFAVKRFIVKLYADQIKASAAKETSMNRELFKLKEKTFLEVIRNAVATNPEYYFKALELIKKLIQDGKAVVIEIGEDGRGQRDAIVINVKGESRIRYSYLFGGISLSCEVSKTLVEGRVTYGMEGALGKGLSEVAYSIRFGTVDDRTEQIERLIGVEYLWAYFEKAYLEFQARREAGTKSHEDVNKKIVNEAIDDLLFG